MTEAPKTRRKPGRKSNAEKAAILAAQEQAGAGEREIVHHETGGQGYAEPASQQTTADPDYLSNRTDGGGGDNDAPAQRSAALSSHETTGLINEALWSHDMQEESVRFDSRHRKWTFRPDVRNNLASLSITCKRGPDERELLISNARFGADSVRDEVVAMIELLDGDLS